MSPKSRKQFVIRRLTQAHSFGFGRVKLSQRPSTFKAGALLAKFAHNFPKAIGVAQNGRDAVCDLLAPCFTTSNQRNLEGVAHMSWEEQLFCVIFRWFVV